jgi:hypothetical protein
MYPLWCQHPGPLFSGHCRCRRQTPRANRVNRWAQIGDATERRDDRQNFDSDCCRVSRAQKQCIADRAHRIELRAKTRDPCQLVPQWSPLDPDWASHISSHPPFNGHLNRLLAAARCFSFRFSSFLPLFFDGEVSYGAHC